MYFLNEITNSVGLQFYVFCLFKKSHKERKRRRPGLYFILIQTYNLSTTGYQVDYYFSMVGFFIFLLSGSTGPLQLPVRIHHEQVKLDKTFLVNISKFYKLDAHRYTQPLPSKFLLNFNKKNKFFKKSAILK